MWELYWLMNTKFAAVHGTVLVIDWATNILVDTGVSPTVVDHHEELYRFDARLHVCHQFSQIYFSSNDSCAAFLWLYIYICDNFHNNTLVATLCWLSFRKAPTHYCMMQNLISSLTLVRVSLSEFCQDSSRVHWHTPSPVLLIFHKYLLYEWQVAHLFHIYIYKASLFCDYFDS